MVQPTSTIGSGTRVAGERLEHSPQRERARTTAVTPTTIVMRAILARKVASSTPVSESPAGVDGHRFGP